MKALKIIALFLGCRLAWSWVDQCGADLGMGETLPFCIECSSAATTMRLLLLGIAIWSIIRLLKSQPDNIQLHEDNELPAQTYRIHWHRIALLLAILTYPLWVWWIDINTIIPGPDALWPTSSSCRYPGVKGTIQWGIELIFVVCGFKVLHKDQPLEYQ
ncbi:MAG: hypothetical protein GY847_23590 [Proteobacteria bacterium]|nr:hypothetical protein [Pseudomonadota bacterium]